MQNKTYLQNDRLLRVLRGLPVDKTPIWLMRQAGRYLPEYRAIRREVPDFLTLCKSPDLACEVTMQPLRRFALDAAIIFSDILTIPDAFGLGLEFIEGEGPCFKTPVQSEEAIKALPILCPDTSLRYVMDAIRVTKQALHNTIPLIGFAGSPWTIAAYMVEGKASKTFSTFRAMMYRAPELLHSLLSILTKNIIIYLQAQIDAGADSIMLFDTWGGLLGQEQYLKFSLQYMETIVAALKKTHPSIPVILFSKNGGLYLENIAASGCAGIGLDWTANIAEAKASIGSRVVLQGNLDPAVLYAHPNVIEQEVKKILQQFGAGGGHIFNLGHGIYPDINPEHVHVLIESVNNFSPQYHS